MIRAPSVSRYASEIHCRSLRPVWRSRAIVGRATLTTVESRNATPEPRTVAATIQRPAAVAYRTWPGAVVAGEEGFARDVSVVAIPEPATAAHALRGGGEQALGLLRSEEHTSELQSHH